MEHIRVHVNSRATRFLARRITTRPIRVGLVVISLILLLGSSSAAGAINIAQHSITDETLNLVRIGLRSPSDLTDLEEHQLQIFAQLASTQRGAFLIAPLDPSRQVQLKEQGYSIEVLDIDAGSKRYYLLYGLPDALESAASQTKLLHVEGRYAVAKPTSGELDALSQLDLKLRPLESYPLAVSLTQSDKQIEASLSANPLVEEVIAQINTDRLFFLDGSLSGEWDVTIGGGADNIKTRYTHASIPINKATQYALEYFQWLGLPTWFDLYDLDGVEKRNVIAQQTGRHQPERVFLLIAHLDSISQNPYYSAPGADDNASGSAALMAIADILHQYKFGCTLRYVLFTGEEQGHYGSLAYAKQVSQAGEDIIAVLNLDMLGYNTPGSSPTIELHTRWNNQGDLDIANLFANVVQTYGINLVANILQDGEDFSDHASFWNYGYPAILAIEDWNDHTPYYHNTSDQLETLNMDYFTAFAKAAAGTFAHMGCLLQGELSGVIKDATTQTPLANAYLETRSENGVLRWTHTQPDGSYHFTLVPGDYSMFIAAPHYQSATLEAIPVVDSNTTVQDFNLHPYQYEFTSYLTNIAKDAP